MPIPLRCVRNRRTLSGGGQAKAYGERSGRGSRHTAVNCLLTELSRNLAPGTLGISHSRFAEPYPLSSRTALRDEDGTHELLAVGVMLDDLLHARNDVLGSTRAKKKQKKRRRDESSGWTLDLRQQGRHQINRIAR